ncbi:MAG: FAD-binding protein [Acidimicrobiales bacterium]|nr:FAD-binding protein [Acidimicrobiales bacterium]
MSDLTAFRNEVGESDPVCVRGGGTHWEVGGDDAGVRSVTAPSGIEAFEPAEMTVTVGAGTTVATLSAALAEDGQEVAIDGPHGSTVGGALMIGRSSLRRGRLGELTDVLLQADCVGADGALFTAGGPTVKNVTGYDLCRLLVGSLGTLALVGRVILRTRPLPEAFAWMSGAVSTGEVVDVLYRPATVLWDGVETTVRVEGNGQDVDEEVGRLQAIGMAPTGEPVLPAEWDRWTGVLPPGGVLEVGAGVVHQSDRPESGNVSVGVRALGERVRDSFDPTRRLNPGRDPHRVSA